MEHNFDNCHNMTCKLKSQNIGYNRAIEDIRKSIEPAITTMILAHQEQLDFVSGLAVANKLIDEKLDELKESS